MGKENQKDRDGHDKYVVMDCLSSKYQSAEEHKLLGYGGVIPCGGLEVSGFTDNGVALENRVFEGRVIPTTSVVGWETRNSQAVVSVSGIVNGRSVQVFYFVPCQQEGGSRLAGPRIICPKRE